MKRRYKSARGWGKGRLRRAAARCEGVIDLLEPRRMLSAPGVSISVAESAIFEGNAGWHNLAFTVLLSSKAAGRVTVAYSTLEGTAKAGSDYRNRAGLLTFLPGQIQKTILVPVHGDKIAEKDETFTLRLIAPTNATLANAQATGTILDDDGPERIRIVDAQMSEGNSGFHDLGFLIQLSRPATSPVTVNFATSNGPATLNDFVSETGMLTFAKGQSSKIIKVPIVGDTFPESNEAFFVDLSSPTGASLAHSRGMGVILNDDFPKNPVSAPGISIDSVSMNEGNAGITSAVFHVTLSKAPKQTVLVAYSTGDGTATGGSDYQIVSGVLSFVPGQTLQTISVPIIGDTVVEPDETFTVNLTAAALADIATPRGTGTILNDDVPTGLSVNDVAVSEPQDTNAIATFTVTLAQPSAQVVMVDFSTANDTAKGDVNFANTAGTLTFQPGDTTQQVRVPIFDDFILTPTLTFDLNLFNPVNSAIADGTGVCSILNTDAAFVTTSGSGHVEGNSGVSNMVFTVSLDGPQQLPISFDYATGDAIDANFPATADTDYLTTKGTVTIPAGQTQASFNVGIIGDTLAEQNETFAVNFSNFVNCQVNSNPVIGTIQDDDGTPIISVDPMSITEGTSPNPTQAQFTARLSGPSSQTITAHYQTADGTALSPGDYTPISGTVTFMPGETTQTIPISITADALNEADETFQLVLSSPSGAILSLDPNSGVATILNDDAPPGVSVSDAPAVVEDPNNQAFATFTVSLDAPSGQVVSVNYQTVNGSAVGNTNFTPVSSTLTFQPGQTSAQINVPILDDHLITPTLNFQLVLSSPLNATISNAAGNASIINIDTATLSVTPPAQPEGTTPPGPAPGFSHMFVSPFIANAVGADISVDYTTADDPNSAHPATAGVDYTPVQGTLTIPAGQTSDFIDIPIVADDIFEPDETFLIVFSNPVNCTLSSAQIRATITNDDPAPILSVDPLFVAEGTGAAPTPAQFTVRLTNPSDQTITADYSTQDGTATSPADYSAIPGSISFAPGETVKNIPVSVVADALNEADETFHLVLSNVSGANLTIDPNSGVATILDDDPVPSISVGPAVATEDPQNPVFATFTVSLAQTSGQVVSVDYTTVDQTAKAGVNYTATFGTLTFQPGQTSQQVNVRILDDGVVTPPLDFELVLSNPVHTTISAGIGTGIINNGDSTLIHVLPAAQPEGNAGTVNMAFTVFIDAAQGVPVSVDFATAADVNGANPATPGVDYLDVFGTVTIPAGQTSAAINVPIIGDTAIEPDETFFVNLSNPVNGTLSTNQVAGLIVDDDGVQNLQIVSMAFTPGTYKTTDVLPVSLMLKNTGNEATDPTNVLMFLTQPATGGGFNLTTSDPQTGLPVVVPAIAPGQTITLNFNVLFNDGTGNAPAIGDYLLNAFVPLAKDVDPTDNVLTSGQTITIS